MEKVIKVLLMFSFVKWRSKQAILLVSFLFPQAFGVNVSRPNILLLMADDLGYGDLGCFGNDTIRTPNIDQLAKEGVRLTHHIAAASLCTPSRAAFLTGRYPIRSGMAATTKLRVITRAGCSGGLPANETTFARLLKQQGYVTGLIGKWHLGLNSESSNDHCHHPLNHGFDYFYGSTFTLIDDCATWKHSVLAPGYQATAVSYAQTLAFFVFICLLGNITGYFSVRWKICVFITLGGIVYFTSMYAHYLFLKHWNCVILRDHDIIQQPLKLKDAALGIVREAITFIERQLFK